MALEFETITDALVHHASRDGGRVALTFLRDGEVDEHPISYGTLLAETMAIGSALGRITEPGDRVLIAVPPGPEFPGLFWGCLWAGLVPCISYPPRPGSGALGIAPLAAMRRDSGARLVVTTERTRATLLDGPAWRNAEMPEATSVEELLASKVPGERRSAQLAYLQYTSGSTSAPKGVRITQGALARHCRQLQQAFDFSPDSVSVYWLPVHHTFGLVAGVILPVFVGYHGVQLAPAHFVERPLRWLEAVSRYRATLSGGPNFAYDMVCDALAREQARDAPLDLSCWLMASMGGEAVQPNTLYRVRTTLGKVGLPFASPKPAYGLSEAILTVSGSPADVPAKVVVFDSQALQRGEVMLATDPRGADGRAVVGVGAILRGCESVFVDPATGAPCASDRVGELWLQGPSVADGYWQRPEESATVFGAVLAGSTRPYLRTGDLGFVHDGELFITGRCKELIIVRGLNYFPPDIEGSVREASSALSAAAVAAFPWSTEMGEGLGVAIEIDDPQAGLAEQVRAHLARAHGIECDYIALVARGTLPRTPSGKLQRLAIANLARARKLSGATLFGAQQAAPAKAPNAPGEWGVVAFGNIIEDVAGALPEHFGPDTRLDELALSSLSVVRLAVEVELRYARTFSIEALLVPGRTVQQLVALAETPTVTRPAPPYRDDVVLPPSVALRLRSKHVRGDDRPPQCILLTGASGYLGANIIRELQAAGAGRIYCLLRGDGQAQAEARLREAALRLTGEPLEWSDRLRVVVGQVSEERFGMPLAEYEALAFEVDTVVHAAAHVNFAYPYEALRETNVLGTQRVLEFCVADHLKPLHFLSTIGVLATGMIGGETRRERDAIETDAALEVGYEQSKWVADRTVMLARTSGLKAWIYRIGFVGGRGADGALLRSAEFFPSFLKGCVQLGAFPDLDSGMAAVPVDWVASVIASSALAKLELPVADLHLVHPAPLTVRECFDALRTRGYAIAPLPFEQWKRRLFEQDTTRLRASSLLDYLPFLRPLNARHFQLPSIRFEETQVVWSARPCPDARKLLDDCIETLQRSGELALP